MAARKSKKMEAPDFFDERRIFRLETKVSRREIRISRSDMHRFVISWRIGADEEHALYNKKEQKNVILSRSCARP